MNYIKEYERLDDLHRDGLKIIQNPQKFCFGIDAVLLSGFAKVKKNEIALDLCTGTGIIPILLTSKTKGKYFYALEIQRSLVEMANRSIKLNKLENIIEIAQGDVKNILSYYKAGTIDVITVNPPYMNENAGIINEYDSKAISRHEILCSLEDIVFASSKVLKSYGRMYMVHRPHRLVDVFCSLRKHNLEAKKIRFVHTKINKEPCIVLIEAVRDGKPMLKVLPPLYIYDEYGKYTQETFDIYYK